MSISKSISLNFSDGVKTVYTKSSTLYVPFEVSYIRIANTYFEPTGTNPLDAVITSNLVEYYIYIFHCLEYRYIHR